MEFRTGKLSHSSTDEYKKVGVYPNVLRKSVFDTENIFYYYFTELRKEQYSK